MPRQSALHLPAHALTSSKKQIQDKYSRVLTFSRRRPLTAFLAALLLLFLIIAASNVVFKPKVQEVVKSQEPKKVDLYTIGKTPTVRVSAQVQKDGLITIFAQSPGIVQKVSVGEGDNVWRGTNLVSLSTNYQGGNAATLSRQLAQAQFQNISDTFDKQKDTIAKMRDLANKNTDNTEDLRKISKQSRDDTNSLLNLNQDIVSSLNSNLQTLQNNNVGGVNDALILATKQQISSFQSAVNQLNNAKRSLDFGTNTDNPPTKIANLSHDVTTNQLDIQEKALDLSKQVSQIQLNLTQVNEALMFPAAPCSGTVQKAHVHVGQSVSPGTPLVTIYNSGGNVSVIARVPQKIAATVSSVSQSNIYIGDRMFSTLPAFVSTQAVSGQLYEIIYNITDEFQGDLTNLGYVPVEIPIGHSDSNSAVPFIPLDAVFQTQDSSYVYVLDGQKAASKKLGLGQVVGGQVEVVSGLSNGDQIILNRNVVAGDSIVGS